MRKICAAAIITAIMLVSMPTLQAGWLSFDGEGPVKTESRDLPTFSQVIVEASMDAEIIQASEFHVEVKAQENLLELITTEVVDDVLIIGVDKSFNTSKPAIVTIHIDDLTKMTVKGSGDIRVSDGFKTDTMALKVMGSGDIKLMKGEFDQLGCSVMGSGDIVVTGTTEIAKYIVKGSGDISARKMAADTVDASVKGSGDIALTAQKTLKASVKGSGDIMYSGDPEVEKSIYGSGDIYTK